MTVAPVLVEAAALIAGRQPFVLATVVWRRGPSSGRSGDKAIILADGTMRGWIGGACATPTVIERARRCLTTGRSEVLLLGEQPGDAPPVGAPRTVVAMACESDGALEVHMEPIVPDLRLVVIGRSPAVDALAEMGSALGWDAWIVDEGGDAHEHTRPERVRTKLDLADLVLDPACAVVVATQGHYDDIALAAALATPAGYIGLVASDRRAAEVRRHLASDGVEPSELDRIEAPAGLDLGAVEHREVAVAIIADLVRRRASGVFVADQGARSEPVAAVDPICGMTVDPGTARYHSLYDGTDYWFCASGCKRAFDADPVAAILD